MTKMFTHPDGTEFGTAKGLMDYVDNLKKEQDKQEATFAKMGRDARFDEMIKEVDVVDKRKTRWHVFHDNMVNI